MEPPTSDRIAFTMFKKYIDAKSGVNYSQLAMHNDILGYAKETVLKSGQKTHIWGANFTCKQWYVSYKCFTIVLYLTRVLFCSSYTVDFRLCFRKLREESKPDCKKPKFKELKAHSSTCVPSEPGKEDKLDDEVEYTSMALKTSLNRKISSPTKRSEIVLSRATVGFCNFSFFWRHPEMTCIQHLKAVQMQLSVFSLLFVDSGALRRVRETPHTQRLCGLHPTCWL